MNINNETRLFHNFELMKCTVLNLNPRVREKVKAQSNSKPKIKRFSADIVVTKY